MQVKVERRGRQFEEGGQAYALIFDGEGNLFDGWQEPSFSGALAQYQHWVGSDFDPDGHLNVRWDELAAAKAELDSLIGMDDLKHDLNALAAQILFRYKKFQDGKAKDLPQIALIVTGGTGTGKTTIARIWGRYVYAMDALKTPQFHELHRGDIIGNHVGDTDVQTKDLFDRCRKRAVIFIDEFQAVWNSSDEKDFGKHFIDISNAELTKNGHEVGLVIAGYEEEMRDILAHFKGMRTRFAGILNTGHRTNQELVDIFRQQALKVGHSLAQDVAPVLVDIFDAERKKQGRTFGNGRVAERLVSLAEGRVGARLGFLLGGDLDILRKGLFHLSTDARMELCTRERAV